jgi:hypothetical protein
LDRYPEVEAAEAAAALEREAYEASRDEAQERWGGAR